MVHNCDSDILQQSKGSKIKWFYLHSVGDIFTVFYLSISLWPYFVYPFEQPLWMVLRISYLTFIITAPLFVFKNRPVRMSLPF